MSVGCVSSADSVLLRLLAHYPEPALGLIDTRDRRYTDRIGLSTLGECKLLDY